MTVSPSRVAAAALITAGALGATLVGVQPATASPSARASDPCTPYYQTSVADQDKAQYYADRYKKTHAASDKNSYYVWSSRAQDARAKYDKCEAARHH